MSENQGSSPELISILDPDIYIHDIFPSPSPSSYLNEMRYSNEIVSSIDGVSPQSIHYYARLLEEHITHPPPSTLPLDQYIEIEEEVQARLDAMLPSCPVLIRTFQVRRHGLAT